jgi:hypothetical protein
VPTSEKNSQRTRLVLFRNLDCDMRCPLHDAIGTPLSAGAEALHGRALITEALSNKQFGLAHPKIMLSIRPSRQ